VVVGGLVLHLGVEANREAIVDVGDLDRDDDPLLVLARGRVLGPVDRVGGRVEGEVPRLARLGDEVDGGALAQALPAGGLHLDDHLHLVGPGQLVRSPLDVDVLDLGDHRLHLRARGQPGQDPQPDHDQACSLPHGNPVRTWQGDRACGEMF